MKADTIRTGSAAVCVAMGPIFLAVAIGGGSFAALLVIVGIFIFALFVGLTQPC